MMIETSRKQLRIDYLLHNALTTPVSPPNRKPASGLRAHVGRPILLMGFETAAPVKGPLITVFWGKSIN